MIFSFVGCGVKSPPLSPLKSPPPESEDEIKKDKKKSEPAKIRVRKKYAPF